ncbi:ABC transporter permease [Segnochrobactrum spirostomi]|uniref:ABC transporter permease subunit n=1 Tax=Segnochrobactrum spirostomi TaxID=2608987 RepID=A0A6A7XYI4_9HYPH|nr:ABC transporter permease subunit [Segnochrobactrum spirostomi]MQT11473.1 ABC transporter permease subunit [Segnochrobactrum spirostomi]
MEFFWLPKYGPLLLEGLWRTILLVVISGSFGFVFAILVGLGRASRNAVLSRSLLGFTSVIRGTPLLVQIFLLYYGLGSVFAGTPAIRHSIFWPFLRDGFWYVVVALIISNAAYIGEVVRAALASVPRGEIEAARAYGMSPLQVALRIWLPRALGAILPTLAGETVLLLKSTALASTVTVIDLLGAANVIRAQTYRTYEPLLFVAAGYFVLTLLIEQGFRVIERRTGKAFKR